MDLSRSSYRLRDDDNIYLGKIEAQLLRAVKEAKSRVERFEHRGTGKAELDDLKSAIRDLDDGLPCVTGIQDATSLIHTGDEISVDGFLGIVTILQRHKM